jgi:hypothetical protein
VEREGGRGLRGVGRVARENVQAKNFDVAKYRVHAGFQLPREKDMRWRFSARRTRDRDARGRARGGIATARGTDSRKTRRGRDGWCSRGEEPARDVSSGREGGRVQRFEER